MSELFGLFPEPVVPVRNPLPTAPRSFGERMSLDFDAAFATERSFAGERALAAEFDRVAPAFREAGVELANPFGMVDPTTRLAALVNPASAMVQAEVERERDRRLAAWDEAADRLQADPETAALYPNVAGVRLAANSRAQQLRQEADRASGLGGGFGGFLGQAGAIFTDPAQLLTLPLGAPYAVGRTLLGAIGRTALIEAGIGAASQAVVEATNVGWRDEAGLESQAMENILVAGAAGGVLGGGLRGLLGLLHRTAPPGREPASTGALAAQDAAAQIDAQLMLDAAMPGGPEGYRAHARATNAALEAVTGGKLATGSVPPAAAPPDVDVWMGLDSAGRRQRTAEAIAGVIDNQNSNTSGAYRADIGVITLDWGRPGDANRQGRGGFGLSHIIARRDAEGLDGAAFVRERLPDILTNGRVQDINGPPNGLRLILADGEDRVILSLFRSGDRENWVVTAYPPKRDPDGTGGGNPRPPYAPAPSGLQATAGAGSAIDIAPALRRFNTYTPTGRSVLVQPQVVDLASLIPSHTDDGSLNPAFPHAEGVQPRDRSAAPSQDQIRAIAAGLIPERLEPNREAGLGAPIIGPDLVVESGNARVLAMRQVYGRTDLAEVRAAYRAHLLALGYNLDGIRNPVLVSSRVSAMTPNERRAFVGEANGRTTLDASAAETARADVARVDAALPLYQGGDIDSAANAPFVRQVLAAMTPEDRGAMLAKGGRLSATGAARIRNAILARAYGDELGPLLERFLETQNEGLRGIAGALTDAAPAWSTMRRAAAAGDIDPAMDTTADLIHAVRLIDDARRRGISVEDLIVQGDLETAMPTANAIMWIRAMRNPETGAQKARPTIAGTLNDYAAEAMTTRQGGDLFGATPPAAARIDAVASGRQIVPDAPPTPGASADAAPARPLDDDTQAGMFDADPEAPVFRFDDPPPRTPDPAPPIDPVRLVTQTIAENSRAAETLRGAPAEASATLQEARRIAAQDDIAIPIEVESDIGTAGVETIGARQLLDEAEDGVRDAAEAAACLIAGAA